MFWEEKSTNQDRVLREDTVDLLFSIDCRELPVDHAYSLSTAVLRALPWLEQEERAAVHLIHVAASQNGWERPGQDDGQKLCLSKRTKFTLRVPVERLDEARQLTGIRLDIDGDRVVLGASKVRHLSKLGTIFSRYVVCAPNEEEQAFLKRMVAELGKMGIQVTKALPLTSPAYDDGKSEEELRRSWTTRYRQLQPNEHFEE